MMNEITQRVEFLRAWMKEQGIGALIVPTMDAHNSEYVAERWQCRRWLTGFTGSAGTAVVTADEARLWTDSRYWLQAGEQLQGTPFCLMRDGEDATVNAWLHACARGTVGYVPDMMVPALYADFLDGLPVRALETDPFDLLWADRPGFPLTPAERMPDEVAGETAAGKLQRLTVWLRERGEECLLLSELSEIAWMLNLRGADIPFNPFLISFLLVRTSGEHVLYVHSEQIGMDIRDYLRALGVTLASYAEAPRHLEGGESPVPHWRAVKNPVEQEGFREAHLRDGVALVQFLRLLDEARGQGWTELEADRVLTALRARQPGFRGLSFETIAGYGPHGAIVHYEATPETDAVLEPHGLLLLDSGAHYDCGTTDITRTIALGPLTGEERRVYTLVLKGHLQLQALRFPEGTVGLQLDTAARMPLWQAGYDFGHGTGHGVGHRLGVHEGPVQIRKNCRRDTTLPFQAGLVVTDEPGIYVPGKFGVRIENVLLCEEDGQTDFGRFLRFRPLTLCPYDLRPLILEMLTPEERLWLNAYHRHVLDTLLPHLSAEADRAWLRQAATSI